MTDIRERDTYVVKDSGDSSGAWVFGIIVALLAALGIWFFVAAAPSTTSIDINEPAASVTTETAPAAPAESTAPSTNNAAPAEEAPAAPAAEAPAAPAN